MSSYHGNQLVGHDTDTDSGPDADCKYGYARLDKDGEVCKVVKRTNPNAKWDWWVVGGRWSGMLLTNRGQWVNQCKIREIDFEAMRQKKEDSARKEYASAHAIIAGREIPKWSDYSERFEDIDKAREEYGSLSVIKDWRASQGPFDSIEDYAVSEDEYVLKARRSAGKTFAIVKDGVWYERGSMGWWGCVSDEKGLSEIGRWLGTSWHTTQN